MEITKEYRLAYVEVLEVLKRLNESDYSKIPAERIELYNKYKDENYSFVFDDKQEIKDQVSKTSQAILANLFIKYISSTKDREKIYEQKRKQYWMQEEEKKNIKLNPLFEQKNQAEVEIINEPESSHYLQIKKDTFINKIFSKIKLFFYKIKSN